MRSSIGTLLAISMLVVAAPTAAQGISSAPSTPATSTQGNPPAPAQAASTDEASPMPTNLVEFGGLFTNITGNVALFQRYRDVRTGPTLNRLRYERGTEEWQFQAFLENAGYRNQSYIANFQRFGKLQGAFAWDQIPLFYSTDTTTPFTSPSAGVFQLNDAFQTAIQNAQATTSIFAPDLTPFDLRSQRNTAFAVLDYWATQRLDLRWSLTSTGRTGAQPFGAPFGQANTVELPVPIDRRQNDMSASAQWSNDRGMARVAYDGSWFNNNIERLIWDNPLRVSDAPGLPSKGQTALWPDSTANTVSMSGSLALPARTRAFGYVSLGTWLQDEALLPFTINPTIARLALPRPTAEAKARIVATNYRLTSRPISKLWLNGQFKTYNYDNQTPRFLESQYVGLDSSVVNSSTGGTEPFGYDRHFVDVEASYTPLTFTAVRLAYGREHDQRTFRLFESTNEQTWRASLDSTGLTWGSLRLQYQHTDRVGHGLDEEVLDDIGEQISLRQFDISDRQQNRLTALVQVMPSASLGFNASLGIGNEHRPGAEFGLQDNDFRTLTVGVDLNQNTVFVLGAEYTFERYATLQNSRQANAGPQFNDPSRNWSTDFHENVQTLVSSLEVPRVAPRTSARIAYDYVHSNGRYVYVVPPGSTLTPPQQLDPLTNQIQSATVDVTYSLSRALSIVAGYWYARYTVQDFARSPGTLNSAFLPALIDLMYLNRPYRANTGSVRLVYKW